jgi:hypothetical protein
MPLFRQRKKSYEAIMLASNPVNYYPLNESGTTCYDMVGGKHLAVGSTMLSETLSERAAGRGFKFGGGLHRTTASASYSYANIVTRVATSTDDYWDVTPTTAFARAATGISVAAWVKVPKNASAINMIWCIGNLTTGCGVDASNTQSWTAQSRINGGTTRKYSTSQMQTDADTWVHLGFTLLNHDTAKQKIFINGVEASYTSQDDLSGYREDTGAGAKGLCLGGYKNDTNALTTVCGIAHIAFYNRVLTAAEMLIQYNLGNT